MCYAAFNCIVMKKALRQTQTLRAGCNIGSAKNFRRAADPFPVARDGQNLISWKWSLPLPSLDRCTQFRVIVVTDPQTNKQASQKRTDYNTGFCFWSEFYFRNNIHTIDLPVRRDLVTMAGVGRSMTRLIGDKPENCGVLLQPIQQL